MNALVIMPEADVSRNVIEYLLNGAGFAANHTEAREAPAFLERLAYDLVMLAMPSEEVQLCRELRLAGPEVALVCISDSPLCDRIAMLEAGADDVIWRPFEPAELLARTKAVVARANRGAQFGRRIIAGRVTLDRERSMASVPWKQDIALTPTERRILDRLMTNPGITLQREDLLSSVWGYGAAAETESNPVDVYVSRLRRKLEQDARRPNVIMAVRGTGYRLNP